MGKTVALTAIAFLWATSAIAQGVPTVDSGLIIRNEASNARRESDLATQRETLSVQEQIAEIEREQLSILQQILDAQTSLGGQGISGMLSALENGSDPEASANMVYDPEDSNPGAAQMFGDAAKNVEELIIQVARETHGLSGVGQAGFSVREWRYMLQALIWQESRFSIGARSPVGAFGLTQTMPGTADDLGIYPEYYGSPYLQLKGGARYLAQMLAIFDGNIIHALAAYNAGPGNVQNYGGVPPFQETQHHVQVIPAKYNEYLARGGGGDSVGTIDPALLANSNLSFTGAGAPVSLLGTTALATYAQGVPTVGTQNIAQTIRQLQQMIKDEILQQDQRLQLQNQFQTLQEQYAQLQQTYAALTGLAEIPEVISTKMKGWQNGLLDQEFGDITSTIAAIQRGDWSGLTGSGSSQIRTQMERVLAEHGFDEDTLSEMANSGNSGAERVATQATTGAMVSATAQNSYTDAGQSLERIDHLVDLTGDMETLKESIDLNTRVVAENGIILVSIMQLLAVGTVGEGQASVIEAADRAEEDRYMDFTMPDLSAN